jgi:pimeloyl-ACP methyl ester carboxylesterase
MPAPGSEAMPDRIPLVLIPGLLCDRALWERQIADLGDVAESSVADVTRDDSMAAMARSVLADAPETFALAGLSMGGYVAHEIMRQAPDRVTRLALIDTSAHPDTPEQRSRRRGLIELAELGRFKGVTPRLLPLLIHPDRQDDEALTAAVMDMAARVGKEGFLRQQRAILGRIDSRPYLGGYAVPTLIVVGRQDALTPPAAAEEMAERIPDAELVVIEDCGHLSTMERPDEVTGALRAWLTAER